MKVGAGSGVNLYAERGAWFLPILVTGPTSPYLRVLGVWDPWAAADPSSFLALLRAARWGRDGCTMEVPRPSKNARSCSAGKQQSNWKRKKRVECVITDRYLIGLCCWRLFGSVCSSLSQPGSKDQQRAKRIQNPLRSSPLASCLCFPSFPLRQGAVAFAVSLPFKTPHRIRINRTSVQ